MKRHDFTKGINCVDCGQSLDALMTNGRFGPPKPATPEPPEWVSGNGVTIPAGTLGPGYAVRIEGTATWKNGQCMTSLSRLFAESHLTARVSASHMYINTHQSLLIMYLASRVSASVAPAEPLRA